MRYLIYFILLISLGGCVSTGTEYKTEVVYPPATMHSKVKVEPPPNVEIYMKKNLSDRESMLTEAFREQTDNINKCNTKLGIIGEWKIKQLKLYGITEESDTK